MAVNLPLEAKMQSVKDLFSGTWKLVPSESQFDANHQPTEATMRFERDASGYRMTAEGMCEGKKVAEQPQVLVLDGEEHSVPNAPAVRVVASCPDDRTITVVARDGERVVGRGSYQVSEDGTILTASTAGTDAQQRQFTMTTVWQRA
jgi:hypothetical protein